LVSEILFLKDYSTNDSSFFRSIITTARWEIAISII
jgi:hypothetical protein